MIDRWIGLATVQPMTGNDLLGEAKGAIVPVVGDSNDTHDFEILVKNEFEKIGFHLVLLEDVERLKVRVGEKELPPDLIDKIQLLSNKNLLVFGKFHAYLS